MHEEALSMTSIAKVGLGVKPCSAMYKGLNFVVFKRFRGF
jgi:hypothetical protein